MRRKRRSYRSIPDGLVIREDNIIVARIQGIKVPKKVGNLFELREGIFTKRISRFKFQVILK